MPLDPTHDPDLRSWLASANAPDTDFPLQNLPLGMFRPAGSTDALRPATALGDQVVCLGSAARAGLLPAEVAQALAACMPGELNAFLAAGAPVRQALRQALSAGLREGAPQAAAWAACLHPQADVEMGLPCRIGDYTDFYTGIHHATTVGRLFRPDQPLLPNYQWVPIGYHGRCSSLVPSGTPVRRPHGQTRPAGTPAEAPPLFGPSQRLDHELELGIFIGTGNAQGQPIGMDQAESHAAGLVLLNDWSARDIQAWEYQPLGPFLSKNFGSTLSPWIITLEALAPFRAPFSRPAGDPQPLPYLDSADNRACGAFDIRLEVWLDTAAMRAAGLPAQRISHSNYTDAYWTLAQLIAHHTVNGCNLQPGDLLGTGTLSGPAPEQGGSLLELTLGGRQAIHLPGGEERRFLQDGDRIELRAHCQREGARRIGFGACSGVIVG